jgi:hypothetical protein
MSIDQNDHHAPNDSIPSERPSQVSIAVFMICASVGLGVINSPFIWRYLYLITSVTAAFVIILQALPFAVLAWLAYKIWCGHNWARISFAALWLLFLMPLIVLRLIDFFLEPTIRGWITIFQVLLQLSAIFLIFTSPGRRWFAFRYRGPLTIGSSDRS